MPKKRLLLTASAGGHWVQLSRLAAAFDDSDAYYATTLAGVTPPTGSHPVFTIMDASRSNPLKLAMLCVQILWLMIKVRPHVVITTGAAPGLLALRFGRLFGAKTVWIDSLANSEAISLSGRIAERYADLWLTQWPHLAENHPKLKYMGSVL